ncbi:MAG: hypothetical protein CMP91_05760 [Gammaproteobacteria bacterium]|nr:hypothetical protein [Gammaproteobacteria bacterium]MAY02496.1 hypothetical protein [Gammaproteobacteria bacterium]
MQHFCVSKIPNSEGKHEIHNLSKGCRFIPYPQDQFDLGEHKSCFGAILQARQSYSKSYGCRYCCNECNPR